MATKLGLPRTSRINLGQMELRVGLLSQAGLLTQEQSVGVLDSVDLNFDRQVAERKAGTPQQTVATAALSSDLMITAKCGEQSKRNMKLLTNVGIADYDTARTQALLVDTTEALALGATTLQMSASDTNLTNAIAYAAERMGGAQDAADILNNSSTGLINVTSITPSLAQVALQRCFSILNPSGLDQASYILGAQAGKDISHLASLALKTSVSDFYTDAEIEAALVAASNVITGVPVVNRDQANAFKAGIDAVLAHADYTGASADSATAVKAAVSSAAAALIAAATREINVFTFPASDVTVDEGKKISIGGLVLTRNATAATGAQLATEFSNLAPGTKGSTLSSTYGTWSGTLSNDWSSGAPTGATVTFSAVVDKQNIVDLAFPVPTATLNKLTDTAVLTAITVTTTQGMSTIYATNYEAAQTLLIALATALADSVATASGTKVKAIISAVSDSVDYIVADVITSGITTTTKFRPPYLAGLSDVKALVAAIAEASGVDQLADAIVVRVVTELDTLTEGYIQGFEYVVDQVSAEAANVSAVMEDLTLAADEAASTMIAAYASAGMEAGTYVMFAVKDPAHLVTLDVIAFDSATRVAALSAATPLHLRFPAGVETRIYKAQAYGSGLIEITQYYALRLVQLDAKSGYPKVVDVWKGSINNGSTISLNNTDFVGFDLAFKANLPSAEDTAVGGDLYHVRDAIQNFPLYRSLDLNDI